MLIFVEGFHKYEKKLFMINENDREYTLFTHIQENLLSEFWTSNKKEKLNQATNSLQNFKKSPMAAAEEIMESIDL